ncbi:DNA-directed RNA polymerase specialized sigma24 family protein [Granulicella aggregans]|uniref:DNA-directed RNA polymerase specialized sigma24 family protein n=1 Tax=Granulicella aggregans TaxID=474949 RepID=A0A7W7Z904_9BACT|nr:hypothetical protein [Granulicella aggregans]MBB5055477.1 DNA-directed RNA polymerase specialized sigma24 family protein [Granulicella aggregans]
MNDPGPPQQKDMPQTDFDFFLRWLSPDHGQAGVEYLDIKRQLTKLFVRKGCVDAEDLAAKTLERAAQVYSKSQDYPSAIRLCYGVARNMWREYLDELKKRPVSLEDDCIPAGKHINEDFTEQEDRCLSHCLGKLSDSERKLILEYHQFQGREKIEKRKHLAVQNGGLNSLRIAAHRIRLKLRDCITGCLQRSAYN